MSAALIVALVLQGATAALAIDMYTPAFPQVSDELGASGSLVGLTLTAFSIGLGLGQLVGGPISDQRGRRIPLLTGGLVCLVGAIGCALAPNIGVLIACRLIEGLGGGVAGVVGRAVLIDLASGARLAKIMSILMGFSGLAPVVAPVVGAGVISAGGQWRTIFWILAAFALLTVTAAALFVPESLASARRRPAGVGQVLGGMAAALRTRQFVRYLLVSTFAGALLFAYVSTSSFVLQSINGMTALGFAAFFASNAVFQVVLTFTNAAVVGRLSPRTLIVIGLAVSAGGVALLAFSAFLEGAPLLVNLAGFVLVMSGLPFISANANALASSAVATSAGSASALLGVSFSVAASLAAPLAGSGGGRTAIPMVLVMVTGLVGAVAGFALLRRPSQLLSR